MKIKEKIRLVARAATFATLAIGGLSAGLSITTFTLAKANDMVFSSPSEPAPAPSPGPSPGKFACS